MVDADLHSQELGSEGNLNLKLEGGKLVMSVVYDGKGGDVEVKAMLDPDYFIDKLAEAIPGEIDDTIFNIIKGALKI